MWMTGFHAVGDRMSEVLVHETWNDAMLAVLDEVTGRINSLASDIANGETTGSERLSIHELVDALVDVCASACDMPLEVRGDGLVFCVALS